MGSISAMNSINRVIEAHGNEIQEQYASDVPDAVRDQFECVVIENNVDSIGVSYQFKGGGTMQGPSIDIDYLAELYPDCDIGY